MYKSIISFIFSALLMGFVSSCSNKNFASSTEQALLIKNAINTNDVVRLRHLSKLPIFYRYQKWESASDGSGFILGSVKQQRLSTDTEFNKHFNKVLRTIQIEGNEVITQDITLALFSEELREQSVNWKGLKLYLLKRGEADVEHIVLLGLDKKSNKLRAIYIN